MTYHEFVLCGKFRFAFSALSRAWPYMELSPIFGDGLMGQAAANLA